MSLHIATTSLRRTNIFKWSNKVVAMASTRVDYPEAADLISQYTGTLLITVNHTNIHIKQATPQYISSNQLTLTERNPQSLYVSALFSCRLSSRNSAMPAMEAQKRGLVTAVIESLNHQSKKRDYLLSCVPAARTKSGSLQKKVFSLFFTCIEIFQAYWCSFLHSSQDFLQNFDWGGYTSCKQKFSLTISQTVCWSQTDSKRLCKGDHSTRDQLLLCSAGKWWSYVALLGSQGYLRVNSPLPTPPLFSLVLLRCCKTLSMPAYTVFGRVSKESNGPVLRRQERES